MNLDETECSEEEFSESQDDLMYIGHILAIVKHELEGWESKAPTLSLVKDPE